MAISDYFKPVKSMTAEEVKSFLRDNNPDDYNLIDVRQPFEYEMEHIPGAHLIPVGELSGHVKELDPEKPTIAYWGVGVRSRAAAAQLSDAGFKNVINLSGGLHAWKGIRAEGAPEAGMAYFSDSDTPEKLAGLAWLLEEGSRKFYAQIAPLFDDREAASLFEALVTAEEHHKASLMGLYMELTGAKTEPENPGALVSSGPPGDIMEGGIKVNEALEWARNKDTANILEFAISLEANAYDLYIKMGRKFEKGSAKEIFRHLSQEEKKHLERMTGLLEKGK